MTPSFKEEIFKALNDIYEKYTKSNGKPTEFISWAFLNDPNITAGGFELHPRSETDTDPSAHYICLYLDDGTFYIDLINLTFFYNGGRRVSVNDYRNLTEEQNYHRQTVNGHCDTISMEDRREINKWLHKIL